MHEPAIQRYHMAVIRSDQPSPPSGENSSLAQSTVEAPELPDAFDALPLFTKRIAADYSPRQAVLALARHLAIGGRDSRPTVPLLAFEWPAIIEAELLMLVSGNPYRAKLSRESTDYQFFPASVVCCPSHLAHLAHPGWELMSKVFALHLPDAEHEEVLQHLLPDTNLTVPESFGYLRYATRSNGVVQILEIANELYDGLASAELKERYRDWQRELFDGFIEYIKTGVGIMADSSSEGAASFCEHETRTIVIPPASILLEHNDGSEAALVIERYQVIPTQLGFSLQTLPDHSSSPESELPPFREGLVLAVDSPPALRVAADTSRIGELFDLYMELEAFPPAAVPLPRLSLPRERLNAATLYPSFEVVPASTIPLAEALAPALVYEAARREYLFAEHRALLDAVLEGDFTLMSRGFEGGMNDDWARLPDPSLPPGVYVYPVQSELQNRHPSLRIVSVDGSGAQRIVMVGIKGAGIADRSEDSVVELPEGVRAPIYKTEGERIASHTWWGGLPLREAVVEASRSIGLLAHVAQFHPELTNRAPFPLRLAVPTMYPVWSDESTKWVPPYEYAELILGDHTHSPPERDRQLHELPFATLITATLSDVRVSTLVDRVFNGRPNLPSDARSRFEDITEVMRFLYRQHGFSLVEPAEPPSLPDKVASLSRVTEYLHHIGERNSENAKQIYQRVCTDTLAIIESIHRRGGHLGGGKIEIEGTTFGIGNGGAPAMRNVDICGGFHDLAAGCHLPWQPVPRQYSERDSEVHIETMKKFDLIYWAETEQWMRLVLFGAPFDPNTFAETFEFYPGHDVMLHSADSSTPRIRRAAEALKTDETAARVLEILRGQEN